MHLRRETQQAAAVARRRDRREASPAIGLPTAELIGHLTADSLAECLAALTQRLPGTPGPILIDCRRMQGYELDARHAFVHWNAENRPRITRVGIVTDNRLWWMVINAMSLASGQPMKGFATPEEAAAWAGTA
jgi:hypothetical protein